MLHLYLTALVAVIAANVIAVLLTIAIATRLRKTLLTTEIVRHKRSQLFLLVGSILPHWRIRPFHSVK